MCQQSVCKQDYSKSNQPILLSYQSFLCSQQPNFPRNWRFGFCRQGTESIRFWERSGRHPDYQSGNKDSNPGSLLVDANKVHAFKALGVGGGMRSQNALQLVTGSRRHFV